MNKRLKYYRRRLKAMESDFETWRTHYQEIQDYFLPHKGKYLSGKDTSEDMDGSKKNENIINGAPRQSVRILSYGMQGGMTNPSKPWFALTISNQEVLEYWEVRQWLYQSRTILLSLLAKSNFYAASQSMYKELALFGTGAQIIEPDLDYIVRFVPLTAGQYYLDIDSTGKPDTLYRRFSMTVLQMVEEFGIDNVSTPVKSLYNQKDYQKRFFVIHCIEPRKYFNPNSSLSKDLPYASVYFEEKANEDKFLRESGYKTIPFSAPRWEINAFDVYGNSPAMDALGDAKQLQKMEEKKLRALDKLVDPPMVAPSSLKKQGGGTIVAAGINYVDVLQGQQGFGPAYQVNPQTQEVAFEIQRVEDRIKQMFYVDLFVSMLQQDKTMTAREVIERSNEKMLLLGQVVKQIETEYLDVAIKRTFNIAYDFGLIPAPPPQINLEEMKIEYLGLLAQAQKAMDITGIEQLLGFVGTAAAVDQQVIDKINFDKAIERYAELVTADPDIMNPKEIVDKIREQRAQQIQTAQQLQATQSLAASAKDLAKAKTNENNVLNMLLEMK